jgi:hypothetical protein
MKSKQYIKLWDNQRIGIMLQTFPSNSSNSYNPKAQPGWASKSLSFSLYLSLRALQLHKVLSSTFPDVNKAGLTLALNKFAVVDLILE